MHKTIDNVSVLDQESALDKTNLVEDRLLNYTKIYQGRRTTREHEQNKKDREPSKEKPDINISSGAIVEMKK